MAKAIALFTGGIYNLIEAAVREDGAVFKRYQEKDPRYGYRWTAWRATGEILGENARANIAEMSAGFSTLHRATYQSSGKIKEDGTIRVRLP